MEYRKLISFGNSSYVVSLPKDWLEDQGLEKGDTVYLDVNGSDITLHPQEVGSKKQKVEKTINVDGHGLELIKRKIDSAYVNNADTIRIQGENLAGKTQQIKEVLERLVAMEIVEQNTKSIVVKSFLNTDEVDMKSILRKTDHIVTSMFEDLKEITQKPVIEAVEISDHITQRDDDVNKMTFLIFRALNRNISHGRSKQGVLAQDMLGLWGFNFFLENIGDLVKRVARMVAKCEDREAMKDFGNIIERIIDDYKKTMRGYYTGNKETKYEVAANRHKLFNQCENFKEEYDGKVVRRLTDKTIELIDKIYDLNRISIMSGSE